MLSHPNASIVHKSLYSIVFKVPLFQYHILSQCCLSYLLNKVQNCAILCGELWLYKSLLMGKVLLHILLSRIPDTGKMTHKCWQQKATFFFYYNLRNRWNLQWEGTPTILNNTSVTISLQFLLHKVLFLPFIAIFIWLIEWFIDFFLEISVLKQWYLNF